MLLAADGEESRTSNTSEMVEAERFWTLLESFVLWESLYRNPPVRHAQQVRHSLALKANCTCLGLEKMLGKFRLKPRQVLSAVVPNRCQTVLQKKRKILSLSPGAVPLFELS